MEFDTFHFLRPSWLLALFPLAVILWRWRRHPPGDTPWLRWVDPPLLSHLLQTGRAGKAGPPWALLALLWLLAVIALAGPAWRQVPAPLYRPAAPPLVILFDISRSMTAVDLHPSRLEAAKARLHDLLGRLPPRRLALVAYGPEAYSVFPLTRDRRLVTQVLEELDTTLLPTQGSNAATAIHTGIAVIRSGNEPVGDMLLVTDGATGTALKAAAAARDAGLKLVVYGVGTEAGGPIPGGDGRELTHDGEVVITQLDSAALRRIAEAAGGRMVRHTRDGTDIDDLLAALERPSESKWRNREATQQGPVWHDEGPWVLLFMLPLAALLFRRHWLFVLPLAAVLHPSPGVAIDWETLWRNPDQQALALLESGEPARAARLFHDPLWRGIAHYRAGETEAAVETFEPLDTPLAHYNRGNALARLGRLPEAVKAYERALALEPSLERARENLRKIRRLLANPPKQEAPFASPTDRKEGKAPEGKKRTPAPGALMPKPSKPRRPRPDDETRTPDKGAHGGSNIQAPPRETEGKAGVGKPSPGSGRRGAERPQQAVPPRTKENSESKAPPPKVAPKEGPSGKPSANEAETGLEHQKPDGNADTPTQPDEGTTTTAQGKRVDRRAREQHQPPHNGEDNERRQAIEQWLARISEDSRPFLKELFRRRHERSAGGWKGPPW